MGSLLVKRKTTGHRTPLQITPSDRENIYTPTKMVKYCVLDLLKCAPEFREGPPVVVSLDPAFLNRVKTLMPDSEASAPEKQILKQDVHERALKKHKNFLRRQRAKQAKQQQKNKEQEEIEEGNKTETSSDSGVSTKSEKKQQQFLSVPKEKYIARNIPKQPQGFKNNFQNQGKLRASSDNDSLNGESKVGGQVFMAQPVKAGKGGSRSWANSRLKRQ